MDDTDKRPGDEREETGAADTTPPEREAASVDLGGEVIPLVEAIAIEEFTPLL